jgi:hypothetical protein
VSIIGICPTGRTRCALFGIVSADPWRHNVGSRFEVPQFSVAVRRRVWRRDAANFVIPLRADQRDRCPVRCERLVQPGCRAWLAFGPGSRPWTIWPGRLRHGADPMRRNRRSSGRLAMKAAKDSTRDILGERAAGAAASTAAKASDRTKTVRRTHRHSKEWVERPLSLYRAQRSFHRHLASAAVNKRRRAAVFYRQPSCVDSLRGT